MVAGLVAESAFGGHFVAIPLGFSDLPFAPLGTLLGPQPKGHAWLETQWLGRELGFEQEVCVERSRFTQNAKLKEPLSPAVGLGASHP